MSSESWFQDPKDEAEIAKMGKSIEGLKDESAMLDRLTGIYGHRRAGSWMGAEAIKREGIRAKLFAKETTHA